MKKLKAWLGEQTDKVEKYPMYLAPLAFLILFTLFILSLFIRSIDWIERKLKNETQHTL